MSKRTDVKSAEKVYEEKLAKVKEKAKQYVADAKNEDKLIKLEETQGYIIGIGKCQGNNRAFPCIYVEDKSTGVGYSFSARQAYAFMKATSELSDVEYSVLGTFLTEVLNIRTTRRKRSISEEGNNEGKDTEEQGEEDNE
jgi:hypothetical protein